MRNLIKSAAVSAYGWWWFFDGPEQLRIHADKDQLNSVSVRRIASRYSVVRAIPKRATSDSIDWRASRIADDLNQLAPTLDATRSLPSVAAELTGIIERWKSDEVTKNKFASGATKLLWFLRPSGWTVYDAFAADGLGITKQGNTLNRMKAFYQKLDDLGFGAAAKQLDENFAQSVFPVSGSRSLDFIMMEAAKGIDGRLLVDDLLNKVPKTHRISIEQAVETTISTPSARLMLDHLADRWRLE